MDRGNIISTREKLGALIKRFLRYMDELKQQIFEINTLVNEGAKIFKDYKRALDIIFYFQALGVMMRISPQHIIYVGFKGMVRRLQEYEDGAIQSEVQLEQVTIYGRVTPLRTQLLSGQLLCRIFYGLIYQQQATTKTAIQEMVENYVYMQKDLNLKNFIPQILNILGILGLIEKNQATQVITYIGPDLKCYDDAQKKIVWKIYQLNKREQVLLGKQGAQVLEYPSHQQLPSVNPAPLHMSYFPELSYAMLRSPGWQKTITDTCFFIGRSEKRSGLNQKNRSYRVDLQLPYRSVSRQHAVIVYNFEAQRWQVRCLSRKNLIRVDGERFAWGDRNVWLRNKCQLQIGPEKMVFLEAANPIE